ncbi:MAG: SulP family inorganic anion transporter [Cyclobacteriaceae bacterium]
MDLTPPATGIQGITKHWKDDLLAAISVSLVALPLALGISLASETPALSGLIAAIVGGVVTTFFRGSHVGINGPAAGLIVVVLNGIYALEDDAGSGLSYVLAATVISGGIQMILGLLKMGKLGDLFPASVVTGMLAAIGLIILAKQFHVALGVDAQTGSALDALIKIPDSIMKLEPIITAIAIISIVILIVHPFIQSKRIKSVPAPLWVLIITVPIVFLVNTINTPESTLLGQRMYVEISYLIDIPDGLIDGLMFPNFSKIDTLDFWMVVLSITMVASIETLIIAKAVDKLDHYKRRTDLNKDLFAIGLSNVVSGCLGGLPIITVIVRSSVNVNHNAKTKWSNFYHGIILLALVFFFPMVIREIPKASLAAILIYTGYKLASPRVFKATLMKGWEQLIILSMTLFITLAIDILWGIMLGVLTTLLIHWLRTQLHFTTFIKHLFNPEIEVSNESRNKVHVEIKGIANFAIMLTLINALKNLPSNHHFVVNFSRTKLVDSTVMEFIHEHREKYFTKNDFEFVGLDVHKTSSPHPLALHVLKRPMQKRLTGRQNTIYQYARAKKYQYLPDVSWNMGRFEKFEFFEFRLLEFKHNTLRGTFQGDIEWEIADITYNDGVLAAREEHHITLMIIKLNHKITEFAITKENIQQLKDMIRTQDEANPFASDLSNYLMQNASYYVEGAENEVLIYRKERLLSANEIMQLHDFAEALYVHLPSM